MILYSKVQRIVRKEDMREEREMSKTSRNNAVEYISIFIFKILKDTEAY